MFFNKELKERIQLLEYENKILSLKVKEIEKILDKEITIPPLSRIVNQYGVSLRHECLVNKYRDCK